MVTVQRNTTATLARSFVGMSKIIDMRNKQVNKAMKQLAEHVNHVDRQIEHYLNHK